MPFIGNQPALSYTSFAVQHFTTSATTSYTLDYSVANENEIRLVINNVVQQPGSSYAYTASGTTLTLSAATSATDTMYAVFLGKAVQTVTPASGSVTNAMLGETITVANGGTGVTTASALANTGNLVLLSSVTVSSGDASVEFTNLDTSTYKRFIVTAHNVKSATDNVNLRLQSSTDNGSSYKTGASDYSYMHSGIRVGGSIQYVGDNDNDNITLFHSETKQGTGTGEESSWVVEFTNLDSDTGKNIFYKASLRNPATNFAKVSGTAQFKHTGSVNAFKFFWSSGNWGQGNLSLYGVKT